MIHVNALHKESIAVTQPMSEVVVDAHSRRVRAKAVVKHLSSCIAQFAEFSFIIRR